MYTRRFSYYFYHISFTNSLKNLIFIVKISLLIWNNYAKIQKVYFKSNQIILFKVSNNITFVECNHSLPMDLKFKEIVRFIYKKKFLSPKHRQSLYTGHPRFGSYISNSTLQGASLLIKVTVNSLILQNKIFYNYLIITIIIVICWLYNSRLLSSLLFCLIYSLS